MKIVTTHKGSDFDALASLVAATLIYPDAKPVLPGTINENLKPFLAIHKDLFAFQSPGEINLDQVDTLIVVDTHSWGRLDSHLAVLREKPDLEIIAWDHHTAGDMAVTQPHFRETGACVTQLVGEIKEKRLLITPIQATLFLMGLYEDTGNLTFPSTLAEDAHTAGFLLDRKADLNILSTFLKQAYAKKHKDILFDMIKTGEKVKLSGFSVVFSKLDLYGRVQNLAMVVQMYKEIANADAAFGIFRDMEQNRCMVIGRSGVDEIDLSLIMRSLGGGGHPGAGSALIKAANPEVVQEMIVEMINGNRQSSVMLSDIMSYPVVKVHEDTPVEKAMMILRDLGCTGMPVVDSDDRIVGVVSRRDFKKVRKSKQMAAPVKAFMTRDVVTISHDKSAVEVARLMIRHDIGRVPVIKDDRIIGIITRSDVMVYFYDMLPD
ncbi:MAG: CBS domain-containing protein [Desulfotignum sp.]|nr:CBS domain-containing protein [Desulfotignum sp.]MCF8112762.1 CBS domain-containing protein [Desulfotignum sp.]MCF8125141.1 CBS domain-containing protein [Desulfotignum sp.]